MKKNSVEKHPVPEDNMERFMGMVYSLAGPFGIEDVPEVYHHVELLGQAIERYIVESKMDGTSHHRLVAARKRFIAIFNTRYLHTTDLEYSRPVTGVDAKMITQVCKDLSEKGMDLDDFLAWVFDTFLPENPKFCPTTLKFVCSRFVLEKFFYENRDKIKKGQEEELRKKESFDLISRARVLARQSNSDSTKEKILDMLKQYRDGGIILETLRQFIEGLETLSNKQEQAK